MKTFKNTMHIIQPILARAMLAASAAFAGSAMAVQDLAGGPEVNGINFQPAATKIAEGQYDLHNFMLILCLVIFILVFGVMFYSILKHRKSVGHKPQELPEPIWVEVGWTLVPFLIVIWMALKATGILVAQKDTTNEDVTIKVTAYQWKWGYDYIRGEGAGLSFISTLDPEQRELSNNFDPSKPLPNDYLLKVDNPMVVPVNKKIRIITTAPVSDVIHSFYVPRFGIKQDAIPGYVRETWFKSEEVGDFYGQCAELCGKEHAYMPIHVKVLSDEDYAAWVKVEQEKAAANQDDPTKEWTMEELMTRGEKVYASNCAACHQSNGQGAGSIKGLVGSASVLGPKAMQMKVLLNGQGNGAMPAWTQLNDVELAAVTTYTKNTWTNKTGQIVQPAEYTAARLGNFPAGGEEPAPAPEASEAAPAEATPEAAIEEAVVDGGVVATSVATELFPVRVYFASGSAALNDETQAIVRQAVDYVKANPETKLVLSGYVDTTGSADVNKELAKNRAVNIAKALVAGGVPEADIDLSKPAEIVAAAGGASQEARRVEISVAE